MNITSIKDAERLNTLTIRHYMKALLLLILTFFSFEVAAQQLKKHNYLTVSEQDSLLRIINEVEKSIHYNLPCKCTHTGSLSFFYSPKILRTDYIPLQEMNKIPGDWNKINFNTLIETVKRTGEIRWYENRIYFIEKDKCRNVYKIYQVSWINTNLSDQDDESY